MRIWAECSQAEDSVAQLLSVEPPKLAFPPIRLFRAVNLDLEGRTFRLELWKFCLL